MALSNTAIPIEYGKFRERVLRGEIPVNYEVSLEMNRIDELIANPDFYYDDSAIEGFIDFCESEMTLVDGSDVELLDTFKLWAEQLLAWFYFEDRKTYDNKKRRYVYVQVKRRLVNKQYLIVGRGAAKSLYLTFLQAYFISVSTETTQQITTAPTMRQAEETMAPFRTAIARSRGPLFKFLTEGSILSNTYSKVKLASTKKGIENFLTNSLLEVRAMSIDKLQGARSKVNTVDEWLSGDIKEDVVGALEQGASKIDDYIIVAVSSEGTARNGVGDTIKMELHSILRGEYYNPHVSIWHYKLDSLEEIGQPDMWVKANPNLGSTVSYASYERDVERAEKRPETRGDILAKRFGIPVEGLTYFFVYEETLLHRKQNFEGMPCSLGADLSQSDDFTAFTFIFPLGGEKFGVKTRSYVTEAKMRKLPLAMYTKYQEFIQEGSLIVMPGTILNMIDIYEDLNQHIMEKRYEVLTLGYDPYNSREFLERWCAENGEFGVEKVIQGARTESVPLGELKDLAEARKLIFDEELMKFAMGNSVALQDNNGNYKLSKLRSEEKIDNVAALMDGWVAYKRHQEVFE